MRRFFFILAGLLCAPVLSAQENIPTLTQRVTDFTNTLSYAEWSTLERETKAFEDTTSNQVVILLIPTLGETSIEEYANRVFESNTIGQKEKDNGVLIVVAVNDRRVRIEVGYGLEGVLTDAATRQIIEQEMKPRFGNEQYFGGLIAAVYAVRGIVAGEYTVDERGREAPTIGAGMLIALILFFIFFLRPLFASRRRAILSTGGMVYSSGWGFRGSGGGFGGFSGGGGLSGGGGATGSW